jgi:outer membrane lipoprotein SlyB
MQTQVISKSPHPLMWVTGIAIILFCVAGLAAFMGWIPSSIGSTTDNATLAAAPAQPPATKPHAATIHNPNNTYAMAKCAECGVIESTREVNTRGDGSGLGAVGGAVVGGVLGHQVGAGRGKDLATVAGAVGGAVAGNEIEKRAKSGKSYEVTVRFDDGSSRVFDEANPTWRNGDHVRVIDGMIRANG